MRVVVFGASGKLGSEIVRAAKDIEFITPSHKDCDICSISEVEQIFQKFSPKVAINCAALVGTRECEENKKKAWEINVLGSKNISKACEKYNSKSIFISTNTVFDGEKGNYTETDIPNPKFFYAVTKVSAEQAVCMVENHIIIRLDFFSLKGLKYEKVFTDHYTGKISVDEAAKKIIFLAKSNFKGIIHIGQKRDSLFNILKPYYPNIEPIKIKDSPLPNFPRDLSFNLEKFNALLDLRP